MTIEHASNRLLKQTAKGFCDSMFLAMSVGGEGENGEPKKLTQHELADKSGVGRSTIAKYISVKNDEHAVINPDLDTICRLADALHVPPALLLMRSEDWSHLAQAVMYLTEAVNDEKFKTLCKEIAESGNANTIAHSLNGLKLAMRFKLYSQSPRQEGVTDNYAKQIQRRAERIRRGILATSALPPVSKYKHQAAILLSLCAIIGAQISTTD